MTWTNASRARKRAVVEFLDADDWAKPTFPVEAVDWSRLVALDFETYYDADYTLSKMSTSEYIRDPRFEALMVGIKVGKKKRVVVPGPKVAAFLKTIPWETHSLLCHNTAFDGLILSHHYKVVPKRYYCSLSMARGLHSNEIGAGLDEVAKHYGRDGKLEGALEDMKGMRYKDLVAAGTYAAGAEYCGVDVDEMLGIFEEMVRKMPADEMELIHITCRMFCAPALRVDLPRVGIELEREVTRREALLLGIVQEADLDEAQVKALLKTKTERLLEGKERQMLLAKRAIGSNEKFAELLRAEGVEPPIKISPTWMKKSSDERDDAKKYAFAFAKDDEAFINLPDDVDTLGHGLNLEDADDVALLAARQDRLRALVDCRIAVKSTTNITRAERFLKAGANGMRLPVGYAYYRAHTGRFGGNNKMNMQNLTRGGELRLSILAAPGHRLAVADSGQIEARVNGWLWGQDDLLAAFSAADTFETAMAALPKDKRRKPGLTERDAYCNFGDEVYGRIITKDDKMERFVGKVCVLGLGFGMGAPKFQITLAKGALGGPPVYFPLEQCHSIVNTYRRKNHRIAGFGWSKCKAIIEDMAAGRRGSYKCLSWEKETIWLPNGMALKYPDLKKRTGDKGWDEWTYQSGDIRKRIYGGLLCENIVQALARIIVMWQMVQIDKRYPVVMTTHDEIVTHPKAVQAARAFDFMIKWMRTAPSWCADIPLFAEGGFDVNYSK